MAQLTEQVQRQRYNYSTKTTETYYETVVHKGEDSFFGYTFPLFNYTNYFQPGQYSFPFSFRLTETLPASFYNCYRENGYDNYGKIVYSVWAGMQSIENKKTLVFCESDFRVDQKNYQ